MKVNLECFRSVWSYCCLLVWLETVLSDSSAFTTFTGIIQNKTIEKILSFCFRSCSWYSQFPILIHFKGTVDCIRIAIYIFVGVKLSSLWINNIAAMFSCMLDAFFSQARSDCWHCFSSEWPVPLAVYSYHVGLSTSCSWYKLQWPRQRLKHWSVNIPCCTHKHTIIKCHFL